MSALGGVLKLLAELVGWGREERKRQDERYMRDLAAKADIDRRHVERRDLSNDKRPR